MTARHENDAIVMIAAASNRIYFEAVRTVSNSRGFFSNDHAIFSFVSLLFRNRSMSSVFTEKNAASTAEAHAEKKISTAATMK